MTYSSEISRKNPGLFIFLIDQSRSMSHKIGGSDRSKSVEAADAINRQLNELINRCTKSEGIRDYFEVGVIGYGSARDTAISLLADSTLVPISELESRILKMEKRKQTIEDQEVEYELPIWFEPIAASDTPMVRGLKLAEKWAKDWATKHADSFPPVIINISDGEATDGDPKKTADKILKIETTDGNAMIWNCHLSRDKTDPISFPNDIKKLPEDKYAHTMFEMSSPLPDEMIAIAREEYQTVEKGARGYVFNAQLEDLIKLLDIGTRAVSSLMR